MDELRYDVDLSTLPGELAARFVPLEADAETTAWIDAARRSRHGRLATWVHDFAVRFLDDFEVNGLLNMHDMFLLSAAQWERLLDGRRGGRLLDVGAGDGAVTARLAPSFDEVVTMETSRSLARRLEKRGFRTHVGELSSMNEGRFECVALLNLLDRVHSPTAVLGEARQRLAPGGHLLLATPLPFDPFVFVGARTVNPAEHLSLRGESWEAAFVDFVEVLLGPSGFSVEAFTRVPYLSRGDSRHSLYARDDVVVVAAAA